MRARFIPELDPKKIRTSLSCAYPTTSRSSARRAALQQLVRVFFSGSVSEAAAALVKNEMWSEDELDSLAAGIERVRQERKRS